jgi:hypothetical protein
MKFCYMGSPNQLHFLIDILKPASSRHLYASLFILSALILKNQFQMFTIALVTLRIEMESLFFLFA